MKMNKIAVILLIFLGVVLLIGQIRSSVVVTNKNRLNVLFYGEHPVFYSVGRGDDEVGYKVSFYPDFKAHIPGGYGVYRVGGLGKLISLEKDPDILQKTFSLLTSSLIDLYFYPTKSDIYYGTQEEAPAWPSFSMILTGKSNATLLDRLYIAWLFFRNPPGKFTRLPDDPSEEGKLYLGYWYDKAYRNEHQVVQIMYTESYTTADRIGRMIEGEGVRVSDLTQDTYKGPCIVMTKKKTLTSHAIATFFNCDEKVGEVGVYDILMKLGEIEKNWEI